MIVAPRVWYSTLQEGQWLLPLPLLESWQACGLSGQQNVVGGCAGPSTEAPGSSAFPLRAVAAV